MQHIQDKIDTPIENIKKYFSWFDAEFSPIIKTTCADFWQINVDVKLFSLEINSKNFFLGNEYFVTQAQVQSIAYSIRLSDTMCELLLNEALGSNGSSEFSLQTMTDLEGNLIFRFNNRIFTKIKEKFISKKDIKNLIDQDETFCDILYLGFVIKEQSNNYEIGKIFLTIPQKLINYPQLPEHQGVLDTTKIKKAQTLVDIYIGKTKLSLEEINHIEPEDIVVLENSNIKKMAITSPTKFEFNINPDPRLFIKDDENTQQNTKMEDIEVTTKDIWDNVQVDVCAKFPKVKMSLGELREMSEGVVMELDSVYNNEVVLEVENKNVAKGELIIIGYKYGVKITEIYAHPEEQTESQQAQPVDSNDDFDVKDFEIEE